MVLNPDNLINGEGVDRNLHNLTLVYHDAFPFSFFFFFLKIFWPWHVASGILVLRSGTEPATPALAAWSLNHWTTGEVPTHLSFVLS